MKGQQAPRGYKTKEVKVIRFQDISFVQFCNILQDNGILNRFFIKSEKNLMSHMEDTVVRQAKTLSGIIYCIAP